MEKITTEEVMDKLDMFQSRFGNRERTNSNFFNEKKARSKIPLKPKAPFKWVFMDIVPSTAPTSLTSDTNFSKYLLTVDAYSKIPKLYGMEKITI